MEDTVAFPGLIQARDSLHVLTMPEIMSSVDDWMPTACNVFIILVTGACHQRRCNLRSSLTIVALVPFLHRTWSSPMLLLLWIQSHCPRMFVFHGVQCLDLLLHGWSCLDVPLDPIQGFHYLQPSLCHPAAAPALHWQAYLLAALHGWLAWVLSSST